jgi:predicted RNase H-like HicB family nuclease
MKLYIAKYIENLLRKAEYEYDEKTKSWCASIEDLPGVYAQADTVEEVREQLAEVIEDYILINLQEKQPLPGFKKLSVKIHDPHGKDIGLPIIKKIVRQLKISNQKFLGL